MLDVLLAVTPSQPGELHVILQGAVFLPTRLPTHMMLGEVEDKRRKG